MSKTDLHISHELALPIEAATQTFAFIARKGGGKTYAAGKLTELLIDAGVQVVVLDTVGNWYGLRLAADGKGKGYDIPVFGGLRKDVALEASAGELVADVVVDTGRSIILDVSQFSLSDRKRFATAFGERLWKKKKAEAHPSPLMLVIEESQLIVPQFTGKGGGDEARMLGIYEEIIRLGRNYGIGCTMISQRPQSVNKEVLNQTECLFVGQISGSQERDALKKWITHQGMDAGLTNELPGLQQGTMYVWSPQWLQLLKKIKIGTKKTFDASATPKVGQRQIRRDPAPLDVKDLELKMAEVVQRAKQDDPKALRAELAKAKAELTKLQNAKPAPVETKTKTVEKAVLKDGQLVRAESLIEKLKGLYTKAGELQAEAKATCDGISAAIHQTKQPMPVAARVAPAAPARQIVHRPAEPRPRINGEASINGVLPLGERAILIASAQYNGGAARDQLTVLTGYKRSTRDAYIQRLREKGYVAQHGENIAATPDGVSALGDDFEPLPTGEALQSYWIGRLPEGERKILEVLIRHFPEPVAREQLEGSTGFKRSTRDAYIQRLSSRRLVEAVGRGDVKASDILFN